MQDVSPTLDAASNKENMILDHRLLISWLRDSDPDIDFFTIGVSLIGGNDIIRGEGNVVTEFDQFIFVDETERVIAMSFEREYEKPLSGIGIAQGDIELANHDDKFTPKVSAEIGDYILPNRPVRMYMGFEGESVQILVGFMEAPQNDLEQKVTRIHVWDAMEYIKNFEFSGSSVFENYRTDQILEDVLQAMGFQPQHYELDVGQNTIPFAWYSSGDIAGDFIKNLVEAELGRFFIDENGIIRFENIDHWGDNLTVTETLDDDRILGIEAKGLDDVINLVRVESNVRTLQAFQPIWSNPEVYRIAAGGSLDLTARYEVKDEEVPAKDVVEPVLAGPDTTSFFGCNTSPDAIGERVESGVSVAFTAKAQEADMTFTNSLPYPVYIVALQLWGRPAIVTNEIRVRRVNNPSVQKYDEHPVDIANDFITTELWASRIADTLISTYREAGLLIEVRVPMKPHRQLGDYLDLNTYKLPESLQEGHFFIVKIQGELQEGIMTQLLTLRGSYVVPGYFTIGVSTIGGTDQIAPS